MLNACAWVCYVFVLFAVCVPNAPSRGQAAARADRGPMRQLSQLGRAPKCRLVQTFMPATSTPLFVFIPARSVEKYTSTFARDLLSRGCCSILTI